MYKFNLEPLLNYRKSIEETRKKDLALLNRLMIEAKRRLNDYKKKRQRFNMELQLKQKEGITVFENLLYFNFMDQLSGKVNTQKDEIVQVGKQCDQKRKDLIEAVKERKALDKLKEKKMNIYKQELSKNEREFLNDVAINGFKRGM